jgi:hypothetical protein
MMVDEKKAKFTSQSWRKNNLLLFIFMQSLIRQESPEIRASLEQSIQATHGGEY